jgi:hypothetical protein
LTPLLSSMPLNPLDQHYTRMHPWACEAGCQYVCDIVSVETSAVYLKVRYRCPTCHAQMTRYYDPEKDGFVEASGIRSAGSVNEDRFVDCRPCAFRLKCPVKEVTRFLRHGVEAGECVDDVAAAAAKQCPLMDERQQSHCFDKLFGLNAHGSLLGRFRDIYSRTIDHSDPAV